MRNNPTHKMEPMNLSFFINDALPGHSTIWV
jgi:hypothetical protein